MFPLKDATMNTDKILLFMEKYSMLPENGRIICAVSGGADSIMLLHYLASLPELHIMAAHYNHHLRGEESDRDELFVKNFCEERGIELFCGGGDVAEYAAKHGKSIEEAARALRYAFLHALAQKHEAAVATAHNADDNGETVLLNLSRGTGLKGLCGIPPVRGEYIRPLLQTSREEIEAYLAHYGLEHIEDSSNATDDYSRNRLRHHVSPVLREINPAFTENVSRMTESLREDEEYFQSEALRFLEENGDDDGSISASAFMALPGSVRMRVLRIRCGSSLESTHRVAIENICLMRSVRAHADIPGMRVTREYDKLIFGSEDAEELPQREIVPGQMLQIPEGDLLLSCEYVPKCAEVHNSFNTFFFKSENICGRMFVGSRQDGDKIRLLGRNCTKSVRKLFSESCWDMASRARCPVIRDENGPIAVWRFGIAQRCAAEKGDDCIVIKITENREGE